MSYMDEYQGNMNFIRGKINVGAETSLYEIINKFVDKYKELEVKLSSIEEDSTKVEKTKEKKRGRPRKKRS